VTIYACAEERPLDFAFTESTMTDAGPSRVWNDVKPFLGPIE
jgi:hypothetical protein